MNEPVLESRSISPIKLGLTRRSARPLVLAWEPVPEVAGLPCICSFQGIFIYMYHADHLPPQFHAIYGDRRAKIAIDGSTIIEGSLPPRQRRLVLRWARQRRIQLVANWDRARRSEPLDSVPPPE